MPILFKKISITHYMCVDIFVFPPKQIFPYFELCQGTQPPSQMASQEVLMTLEQQTKGAGCSEEWIFQAAVPAQLWQFRDPCPGWFDTFGSCYLWMHH